jgi:N-acetylneuraminic acid mutarotase
MFATLPVLRLRVLLVAGLIAVTSLSVHQVANAQTTAANEWTWIGGSSTIPSSGITPGVYGALGTPAAGNVPGSRGAASSWTDTGGNLWLFGGDGFDANSNRGSLNDLWELNPSTNLWAWMGGSSTLIDYSGRPGVYGILGTPAIGNIPGGRYYADSWTDSSGHLWLFGGYGYDANGNQGDLNDLWELKPSTNEWAWMGGSSTVGSNGGQAGVYGTLGTPAAGNIPGGRDGAFSWTDSSSHLWLFGGYSYDANGNQGDLNDLWEFNPSTNEWAWMGGSSTVPCTTGSCGPPGVYGTLGTPAAGNIPGGRAPASSWTDSSGNLWLFGGEGYVNGNSVLLNDLWEFNPSTSLWTWMGGSSYLFPPGVYGTLGMPAAGNIPGCRDNAVRWTDSSGNFWLSGGHGCDASNNEGYLNDLWEFNPSTDLWAWMGGSSTVGSNGGQPGVYGTLGTPAAGNIPGARDNAVSWTDSSGHLWLSGGYGYDANGNQGYLNDLWEYQPSTATSPALTATTTTLTPVPTPNPSIYGESVTLTASVSSSGGTPPNGENVTFLRGTTSIRAFVLGTAQLNGGVASLTTTALPAGTDTITAVYGGDADFAGSTSTAVNQTVSEASSTTTLISSVNPSVVGQSIDFTVTVTGQYGGMATGTVTFSNGSTSLGSVPLRLDATGRGSAVLATTALPLGTDSVTAVYSGDSDFSGSTSNAVSQVVTASTGGSASNGWAWMGGSSTVSSNGGQPGVYGTLGTPAAANTPGGRSDAVRWTDSSGHLWLFGGDGYDANGTGGWLNDLWEFNPSTNRWTWMDGSNTVYQFGVYGTLGTPAAGNIPGGRYAASSWTDSSGHLWLFGGFGMAAPGLYFGFPNDLWEFNPSTNEWTWMGGSSTVGSNYGQPGVYGTLGTPAAGNIPGGRRWASSWTDSSGHLWLFGGDGYDASGTFGYLNDLWEFNPSTNQWTWMGGSSTVPVCSYPGYCGQSGVYGTLGVPAAGNIPGGRYLAASWTDSSGHLWLFGGAGYDANGNSGLRDDLWEFNPSLGTNGEWAWMGGSSTNYPFAGVYGTSGTPAAGNIPGGRTGAVSWTDSSGHLWLFGGEGYDASGTSGSLNDLWEFNPSTNEWVWMGGSSTVGVFDGQLGVYGTLGTRATGNVPGGRYSAVSWTDNGGNLWLFGGSGYDANDNQGYLNDLWEYQPPPPPKTTTTTLTPVPTPNPSVYGESVTLTASVSSSGGAPPNGENVTFLGGSASLGTAQLSSGSASLATTALLGGTDSITAVYGGDANFAGSTSTAVSQVVNEETPSVTTWPTASSITYGQTLASSTLSGGASVPAGSFAFTTPTTAPNAGTASQSVTFTPTDATDYSTLTGTASVTVNKATSSVTTWPTASSITYGQTLASSTLSGGASTPAGSFAFTTPTTAPGAGTASQSVTFTPTDATDYSTLTGTVSVTVNKASSSTTLVSSVNPSAVGQSVNLTATVTGPYGGMATGTVTFSNGSTSLGSASLSGGSAVLATTALPLGTNSITAVYGGDTSFTGSTSNSVSQVVNQVPNPAPVISGISPGFVSAGGAAFTLTVTGSGFVSGSTVYWGTSVLTTTYGSATQLTAQVPATDIATGGITVAITVVTPTPGGGTSNPLQFEVNSAFGSTTGPTFSSTTATVTAGSPASYPVTLPSSVESASATCLNLPTGATCSYSATTNTLTITTSSTTPKGTYQITVVFTETVSGAATSWILLPILLLPLVYLRRKLAARGVWVTACLGLVLLATVAYTSGCGGSSGGSSSPPPPQTHQVVSSGSVSITIQ